MKKFLFIIFFCILISFKVFATSTGYIEGTQTGGDCIYALSLFTCGDGESAKVFDLEMNQHVPRKAVLNGITVQIAWRVSVAFTDYDMDCQLVNASGTAVGDVKSVNVSSVMSTTQTMGGSSDDWGAGLDYFDIVDEDFGVECTASRNSGIGSAIIDSLEIDIDYTKRRRAISF